MAKVQIDPLNAISSDVLKELKKWGTIDLQNGTGGHWQKPSQDELLNHFEDRQFELSGNAASYQYKGGYQEVYDILSQFPASPGGVGAKGVQITMTKNGSPVADISVTVLPIKMKPRGETPKEEADYGSDDEGNTDYDDWTMKRKSQLTNDKWSLQWEDTKNWLPFSWFGKQLIDPWTLAAYKMLVDGGHLLGEVVTITAEGGHDKTDKLNTFVQRSDWSHPYGALGWKIGDINPISVGSTAFRKLMEGKVLILKHTWTYEWVVSKNKFEKMKDEEDDLTPEQKQKYQEKMGMKGLIVATEGRGNNDGPVDSQTGEATSATYTITRTFTWKRPYTPDMKSLIPRGLKLVEPPRDPEP